MNYLTDRCTRFPTVAGFASTYKVISEVIARGTSDSTRIATTRARSGICEKYNTILINKNDSITKDIGLYTYAGMLPAGFYPFEKMHMSHIALVPFPYR